MKKDFTLQVEQHALGQHLARIIQRYLGFGGKPSCYLTLFILIVMSQGIYGQTCQLVAGEISGPSDACAFMGNYGEVAKYTVEASNASGFVWTIPGQTTLLSGQGTNTIRVKYKTMFMTGNISVEISSACPGDPIIRTLKVNKALPGKPVAMDGPSFVCDQISTSTPVTYSIASVPDAVRYRWLVSAQTTIISGQGTTSITVQFSPNFKSGVIRVRAISDCGKSAFLQYPVTSQGALMPSEIAGRANGICSPDNVIEYSINPVPSVSSYIWATTVPGAVITNQGTKATISFPPFNTGVVTVKAVGHCGTSALRRLNVSSKGLSAGPISGPVTACQGSIQTFQVDPVAGANYYNWSVPNGSVINTGIGTPVITVLIGPESGPLTVRSVSGCDPGTAVTLDLAVEQCGGEVSKCKFDLYPNPTAGILHLRLRASAKGAYKVCVKDIISGATVFTASGTYDGGDNQLCLDLSDLQDGCYLFYITTNEFNHQERIEIRQ